MCPICCDEIDGRTPRTRRGVRMCRGCAEWDDYWSSLTEEERDREYDSMAAYSVETMS